MTDDREKARPEFRLMMNIVFAAAVLMVAAAMIYLVATGDLTSDMVIATMIGVFLSVLLGAGLMAASYFSDKSGHDREVNDAARGSDADR